MLAAGALAVSACRSAASLPSRAPGPVVRDTVRDVMVRTRVSVGDSFSPQTGAAAIRAFVPEVAPVDSGGECMLLRTGGSGATIVTAFFPKRTSVQTQVNITFDSSGRLVRYAFGDGRLTMIAVMTRTIAAIESSAAADRRIDAAAGSVPSMGRCRRQFQAPRPKTSATNTSFTMSA
jgi:hypothetical protein